MRILAGLIFVSIAVHAQNDAPKRTIVDSAPARKEARKAEAPARDPGSSAFDALISSTENLNTIRDSNVRRLAGDGCSPEASARIAEIRARLGIKTGPARKDSTSETAMLALATNWFKAPAAVPVVAQQNRSDLLEAVLPGSEKKSDAAQDTAALQTEMDRLLASCAGAKR